jgi:hypothetical protein
MESVPTGKVVVVKVATPPDNAWVPMVVPPLRMKFTYPVGVAPMDGVTVAVNVTEAPYVDGFSEEVSAVVVVGGFTTWRRGAEVVDRSFPPK